MAFCGAIDDIEEEIGELSNEQKNMMLLKILGTYAVANYPDDEESQDWFIKLLSKAYAAIMKEEAKRRGKEKPDFESWRHPPGPPRKTAPPP